MDFEQAINDSEKYLQVVADIQEVLFSNNLNISEIKSKLLPFINSRDQLFPILFTLNEAGFSRSYPSSFFNEIISFLSPKICQNFSSDEVASIFSKSTRNYIPLFHYGCINIHTIINRSYLSEGVFKMFHIVIEKHDPIYYQITLQKASPSLKTFIKKNDIKSRETITAIQNDNYDHVQTVASRKNLSLSSKIPLASTQINDNIKHSWQMPSMLEYAAMEGSLDTFKYLLLNGADITENLTNFAVRGGNYEIIHILEREKHLSFNERDFITSIKYNRNDITDYISNNYNQNHSLYSLFEAVDDYNIRYFLDHFDLFNEQKKNNFGPQKVDVNWVEMWHQKKSLLNIVAKNGFLDFVVLILNVKNANVNIKGALDGFSPLHEAASSGFYSVVKLLVDKGADITQLAYHGETPLHVACSKGHIEIVKFLIEKENLIQNKNNNKRTFNLKDSNGDTPLHLAARNGFNLIVEYLINVENLIVINEKNKCGETPLTSAIKNSRIHVVEVLCSSEKVDVNLNDVNYSPLQLAVIQNVLPIVKVIVNESADRLNINASVFCNTNPLQQALKSDYNDIALFLLDNPKIDLKVKNNDNRQILSYASETGNIEVVKKILLIRSNMQKNSSNKKNDEDNNQIIDNENDITKSNEDDKKSKDEVNITDSESNNANNNDDVQPNTNNDKNKNCNNNETSINDNNNDNNDNFTSINDTENETNENSNDKKRIIDAFDINDADFFGQTALHLAVKNGHFEIAQLLIDAGIDRYRKNTIFLCIFILIVFHFILFMEFFYYFFIKLLFNASQRDLKKKLKNFLRNQILNFNYCIFNRNHIIVFLTYYLKYNIFIII